MSLNDSSLELDSPGGVALYKLPEEYAGVTFAYYNVFEVVFPVVLALVAIMFGNAVVSLVQRRRQRRQRRILQYIVAASGFSLVTIVLTFAHFVMDWEGRELACSISPAVATCTYVISSSMMYLFLHTRAQAVTYGNRDRVMKMLLKLLFYITCSVPLLSLTVFWVIEGRIIAVPELDVGTICAYKLDIWVVILFLALDTSLSLGYVVVFAVPVYQVMRKTRNLNMGSSSQPSSGSKRMARMVMQNLRASFLAIASTFTVMVLLVYGSFFLENETGGARVILWTWTYPLVATDLAVNMVAIATITNLWLPDGLRAFLCGPGANSGSSTPASFGDKDSSAPGPASSIMFQSSSQHEVASFSSLVDNPAAEL